MTKKAAGPDRSRGFPLQGPAESGIKKRKDCIDWITKSHAAPLWRERTAGKVYPLVHQKAGTGAAKGTRPGETEVCTAREILRRPLSVEVCPDFRYVISYTPAPGVAKDVVFFAALCRDGSLCVQPEEIKEAVWLPFERALGLVTHEGTREVLRAAERYFATRDGLSEKA